MPALREVAAKRGLRLLHAVTHRMGFHVTRYSGLGVDADADISRLLGSGAPPTVFDVGANTGQSVARLKALLPNCLLHAFEPSPESFRQLQANTAGMSDLRLVPAGVGRAGGVHSLLENNYSDMTSFLRPSTDAWGTVVKEVEVTMISLDAYCAQEGITRVDLLKVDTQGYDLEVLRGATELLSRGAIGIIKLEVIFSDMYEGAPGFDELYRFLADNGFRLVAFYDLYVVNGAASWADAIFVR